MRGGCCSAPMFSCDAALRLREFVAIRVVTPVGGKAVEGPAMVVEWMVGARCGLSGEEERNRGRRDMAVG